MGLVRTAKSLVGRLDNRYVVRKNRGRFVRRTLIVLATFAVLVAWGAYAVKSDATPASPGPLTSAHGMWDGNNCQWCHAPAAGGGFVHTVDNAACTRCHDGPVHTPHVTQAMFAPNGGGAMRDAGKCTTCHVEHRGHERLVARADTTCTQCHADVQSSATVAVSVKPQVTAFAAGNHPAFGRSLTDTKKWADGTPALRDPTPLRYNHKKHQESAAARTAPLTNPDGTVQQENCTACHRAAGGGPTLGDIAPVNYAMDCAKCHALTLLPGMNLPHTDLAVVRSVAAGQLGQLPAKLRRQLDAMSESERAKALNTVRAAPAAPAGGRPGAPGGGRPGAPGGARPGAPAAARPGAPRPGAPAAPVQPLTDEEKQTLPPKWVEKRAAEIEKPIVDWYLAQAADPSNQEVFTAWGLGASTPGDENAPEFAAFRAAAPWRDERVLGVYVAQGAANNCGFCHKLADSDEAINTMRKRAGPPMAAAVVRDLRAGWSDAPAAAPAAASAPAAGEAPAAAAAAAATPAARPKAEVLAALYTVPTGFGGGPRRWFVSDRLDEQMSQRRDRALIWPSSSHFDHRAHRMVQCLDCHGQEDKTAAAGTMAPRKMLSEDTADVLMPKMESCAACHVPRLANGAQGAEARCQVCHVYHDRSNERPIDGTFVGSQLLTVETPRKFPPATRPSSPPPAAPAGPVAAAGAK